VKRKWQRRQRQREDQERKRCTNAKTTKATRRGGKGVKISEVEHLHRKALHQKIDAVDVPYGVYTHDICYSGTGLNRQWYLRLPRGTQVIYRSAYASKEFDMQAEAALQMPIG